MMRALWTAASGMIAQQTNIDNVSNNLANVNTIGYKKESIEFKSLLYQNLQSRSTNNAGENKPVAAQVGLGTRTASITSIYTQGNLIAADSNTWFAIEGDGFFKVRDENGETVYTRDGSFFWSVGDDGNITLVTSDGYPVLDSNNNPIVLDKQYDPSTLVSDRYGNLSVTLNGEPVDLNVKIGIVQFNNPAGLVKLGGNYLGTSIASGDAIEETPDGALTISKVHQHYIEASNVQVVDEMVNMIVAQRAYEMNSKAIRASDEMLQQANNLRG